MMRSSSPIEQPFDIETALADDDWRQRAAWPLPLSATRDMLAAIISRLDTLSRELPDPDGDTVTLAGMWIFTAVGLLANAATQIEAGAARGIRMVGSDPALRWLSGNSPGQMPPASKAGFPAALETPNLAPLRRVARIAKLNSPVHLSRALFSPRHLAVSHNHLLEDVARRGLGGIGFHHSASLLASAKRSDVRAAPTVIELGHTLTREILALIPIGEMMAGRLRAMIAPIIERYLADAARDLASLRVFRELPQSMWSGTGGAYTTRALALEIRRRGGEVTNFDHGGCSGMFMHAHAFRFIDLRTATTYVTMTKNTAKLVATNHLITKLPIETRPNIVGHDGDPTFRRMTTVPKNSSSSRPKILYPLGPFLGFRQGYPPLTPDPVYYDFLHRVIPQISSLPVDLVLKPRPAGGRNHPMESLANADYRLFEQVLPEADVVLFDDVHSTTFWETLCSDRRMVLIDLGHNKFVPEIERLIQARVHVVPVCYDEANIPRWDSQALANALLSNDESAADPTPFIRLLASSGSASEATRL